MNVTIPKVTIDTELSDESENPVQNRVIATELKEYPKIIPITKADYKKLSEAERKGWYEVTDEEGIADAENIGYDNTSSGMDAGNVQNAVDELHGDISNFGKTFNASGSGESIQGATLTQLTNGITPTLTGMYMIQIIITPATAYSGRIRTLFANYYTEIWSVPHTAVNHCTTRLQQLNANTTYRVSLYLNSDNTVNYSIRATYIGNSV